MSPAAQKAATEKTRQMLKEMPLQELRQALSRYVRYVIAFIPGSPKKTQ
jgi:hypothetical protein